MTLARQVGSGGHAIATGLSDRSGLRVVGRRELRDEATRKGLSLPESFVQFASEGRGTGELNHYLSYGELEFDIELRGGTFGSLENAGFLQEITAHSREILLTLQVLIYELAAADNVLFVGAGAQILLADLPGVLRVKIIAPIATRIERMVAAYGLSDAEARSAVLSGDREQIDYNRVIFGEDWENPELWDVVINSESLSVNQVVDLVSSHLASVQLEPGFSPRLRQAAAINRTLLRSTQFSEVFASAVPAEGGIAIQGEAPNDELRRELLDLANTIAGSGVSDNLSVHAFT